MNNFIETFKVANYELLDEIPTGKYNLFIAKNTFYDVKVYLKIYVNETIYNNEKKLINSANLNYILTEGYDPHFRIYYLIFPYFNHEDLMSILKTSNLKFNDFSGNERILKKYKEFAVAFIILNSIPDVYVYPLILGQGFFGVTYIGYNFVTTEALTIKILTNPEMFQSEVKILDKVKNQPNIINLKSSGQIPYNKLYYISSSYIHGKPINKFKFAENELFKIFYKLAIAVQYIHQQNIIHLDIKPDNIIYDNIKNEPYLIDFGLACFKNECQPHKFTSVLYSTPESLFQTPEVFTSEYTDVYSLGITFYEILVGNLPYDIDKNLYNQPIEIQIAEFKKILYKNDSEPFSEKYIANEKLRNLIRWMTKYNPVDRPTIEQVIVELSQSSMI